MPDFFFSVWKLLLGNSALTLLKSSPPRRMYSHNFMRVVVGQHNLDEVDAAEQVFDIEEVVRHQNWE